METSGSPSVCNQAGDAEMDQEGAVHGRTFAAHSEKEGDRKSKTIDFFFFSFTTLQILQDQFNVSSHEVMTHPKGVSHSCSAAAASKTLG